MNTIPSPDLAAELSALRRRVRALTALVVLLAVGVVAVGWSGRRAAPQTPPGEEGVLLGRSLYLSEDPQRPYVILKFLQDGAGLILADDGGRGQAQLVARKDGGRLALGGSSGLEVDGTAGAPALTLRDERGRERLRLAAGADGVALTVRDELGRERAALEQRGESVRLRLRDETGRVVFEAPPGDGR